MTRAGALTRLGARHRAEKVATDAMNAIEREADPTARHTEAAQAYGMLHLAAAQMAAKDHRDADASAHLAVASDLSERTGERNHLWFSFGRANVRAWSLSVAVVLDRGPAMAEQIESSPGYAAGLHTADRRAALHFDLARASVPSNTGGDAWWSSITGSPGLEVDTSCSAAGLMLAKRR